MTRPSAHKFLALAFIAGLVPVPSAFAHVTMPAIFSDHMVLQRNVDIPVWGTADPQEPVVVTLGDEKADTVAGADGKWKVKLPPMKEGGPYVLTAQGSDTATANDVLIGEVWLFTGQSNMEWATGATPDHGTDANFPQMRLCTVPHTVGGDTPAADVPATWVPCDPKSVIKYSAVAYFAGREIFKKLNVPVGLVQATWSGTNIEGWVSKETILADPDYQPLQDRWARKLTDYPKAKADYDAKVTQFTQAGQDATAAAKSAGRPPDGPGSRFTPWGIYDGMIAPIGGYAVKGIVWYQGENNVNWAFLYRKELAALITNWRQLWGMGDLPFIVVQLPAADPNPADVLRWAELRESQAQALHLPNTALVVTIDLGDPTHHQEVHVRTEKQPAGERTALVMERLAYGMDVADSGPMFKDAAPSGDSIRVEFDHGDGLKTKDGSPVVGFELAGSDGKYVPASATIDGNAIVLKADGLSDPATVRYDWANYPEGNLYNGVDLPAAPFRTDTLPAATQNSR